MFIFLYYPTHRLNICIFVYKMYSDYDDTIENTVSLAPSVSMVTSTDLLAHLIHV